MRAFSLMLLLLAGGGAVPLHAQPARNLALRPPAPAPGPVQGQGQAPTQVGAGDIFAALTQPDRPAELEALHALQDALRGPPDPDRLEAARARLATVLQAEERHQGDMPPALVMSGIASRIEAAMASLEAARRAPPPDRLHEMVLPGLSALAAALGVALIACLAGLAARGRQAEAAEEMQDTLNKIRRRLESGGAGTAPEAGLAAQSLAGVASGEASEAVHQAAAAVDRLGSAARDTEGRLQGAVGDAEARLHAAASMAGQLEQWMEALPERLSEAVQAMETRGLVAFDAAAARLEDGVAPLAGIPDLLADYGGAVSGLTVEAEAAAVILDRHLSALGERLERLACAPAATPVLQPTVMSELSSAADLLGELTHLAMGHAARLEDIIGRADKVAYDLPAVAQVLESASAHLLGQLDRDAKSGAALEQAAETLAGLARQAEALAGPLPDRLAAAASGLEAELKAGTARAGALLGERLAALADALQVQLAGGAGIVQARFESTAEAAARALGERLAQAFDDIGNRLAGRAELLQAGLDSSALVVSNAASGLPAVTDSLREAVAQLTRDAGSQAAALQDAAASLAAHGAALLDTGRRDMADAPAAPPVPDEALHRLAGQLGTVAAQLDTVLGTAQALRAQAAAEAEALRAREAEDVASLFEVLAGRAEACLGALPAEAAAIAATAAQLRGDAAELAAAALRIAENPRTEEAAAVDPAAATAALQAACQRLEQCIAGLGETGGSLSDGAARIGQQAQLLQDGSAATQARLAASAASAEAVIRQAVGTLAEVVGGLQAGAASGASDPALELVNARLAALIDRLDIYERSTSQPTEAIVAGPAHQAVQATLAAQAERLAALLDRAEALAAGAQGGGAEPVVADERAADATGAVLTQAGRIADLLARNEQVAERLAQVVEAVATSAVRAPQLSLGGLTEATDTVQRAAARLIESADAQASALARAGQAAAAVARFASVPAPEHADGHALAGLTGLARLAESLQGEAESLAASALRGDAVRMPPELMSQTPVMLAAIETSIHRLRGTATALALASDAHRKAA